MCVSCCNWYSIFEVGTSSSSSDAESHQSVSEHDEKEKHGLEEDKEEVHDEMSDISEGCDLFDTAVFANATWRTLEDEDELIASIIMDELRSAPLCPPSLDCKGESWQQGMDSGAAIPDMHCAFKGCLWAGSLDDASRTLEQHVLSEHLWQNNFDSMSPILMKAGRCEFSTLLVLAHRLLA